jgi:4-hydroxy-tetrahydrodipicolinate synthase
MYYDPSENLWPPPLRHNPFDALVQAVFFDTNPIPIKYMARRLGIVDRSEHRLPMLPATEELERRLDQVLLRAGLSES